MSARTLDEPLADCSCGHKPCIHKQQVGGGVFLYSVSCTVCGLATERSEFDHEAYAWWNEGDVRPAADLMPHRQTRRGANAIRRPS